MLDKDAKVYNSYSNTPKKCGKVSNNIFRKMKFINSICLKIKNMRERFNQTFTLFQYYDIITSLSK